MEEMEKRRRTRGGKRERRNSVRRQGDGGEGETVAGGGEREEGRLSPVIFSCIPEGLARGAGVGAGGDANDALGRSYVPPPGTLRSKDLYRAIANMIQSFRLGVRE